MPQGVDTRGGPDDVCTFAPETTTTRPTARANANLTQVPSYRATAEALLNPGQDLSAKGSVLVFSASEDAGESVLTVENHRRPSGQDCATKPLEALGPTLPEPDLGRVAVTLLIVDGPLAGLPFTSLGAET